MKKNVIALSAVAALFSMAGVAKADVVAAVTTGAAEVINGTASVVPATTVEVNERGLGHKLVFPYYTTQGSNNTLINVVNTDTVNGKAVKVRFRGAGNSDDLFDFQVLMSPGDVWTASLAQGADGVTKLTTTDNTCVIPSKAAINTAFTNTVRVDPSKDIAAQTREGYVEIINMADIPPVVLNASGATTTNALFATVKHNASGVATCDSTATGVAVLAKLKIDPKSDTTASTATDSLSALGLTFPSTGLAGDWVILNTESQAAWSGSAVALEARAGGVAAQGNAVFFPQLASDYAIASANLTTDPLLVAGVVSPLSYDFPDLSTSYYTAGGVAVTAQVARDNLTTELSSKYLANEWNSDANIGGSTDLLFAQPMRRYWAAVNYKASAASAPTSTTGTVAVGLYNPNGASVANGVIVAGAASSASDSTQAAAATALAVAASLASAVPYRTANTTLSDRLLCLKDVSLTQYDREEGTTTTDFVVSPGTRGQLNICGEAAVTSINAGGADAASALEAAVARNDVTLSFTKDGWLSLDLAKLNLNGLPVVGASFVKVSNAVQSYGFAFPHKTK